MPREFTHAQIMALSDGLNALMLLQDMRKDGYWEQAGLLMDHLRKDNTIFKADAAFRGQPVEVVK